MKQSQLSKIKIIASLFYNYVKTPVPYHVFVYDDTGNSFIVHKKNYYARKGRVGLDSVHEAVFLHVMNNKVKDNIPKEKRTARRLRRFIAKEVEAQKNILYRKDLEQTFIYVIARDE